MKQPKRRTTDYDESDLRVTHPEHWAAGVPGVAVSLKRAFERMGASRTARTLTKLNQAEGFDCMSCAWPDPDPGHRSIAEFCENGAKAVAEEATTDRATPEFFARHSIAELDERSEYWLGQQGRITNPMVKQPGDTHYRPIDWEGAFALIGRELQALDSPDEATFYTSGRASNEAAFAYQLLARAFGTNNLPDCSNMCHESTSIALQESIGIGKASVVMSDLETADLIIIAGQNPGTNHPRMLTHLEMAKERGAKILTINPLREAGLTRFKNPQRPKGVIGHGTALSDLHLPIRINGDLALFQAIGSLLVEWDALDHEFIERHTTGFDAWKRHVEALDWDAVLASTGLTREEITRAAEMLRDSRGTVFCWAMGVTQHRNGVATIKEITNVALAQGNIGRQGAGLFPVRGHSNVQGDRTMGIWERVPDAFLDSLQKEFGFDPPREHGLDTVDSVRAMRDGKVKVFVGLGGNFAQATPDTDVTATALRRTRLTVQISTKVNRSHLVCGEIALILPALGRTEKDVQATGPQWISVEDSTCSVHSSRGPLPPAGPLLRSEVAIVTGIAEAALGDRYGIDWSPMRQDYRRIREHIARVVPGCESYEVNARRPGGFVLPHPPRDSRTFPTESGSAEFVVSPVEVLHVPDGHLLLQTMRSHDQFNTTIYGLSDRYRGIEGGRRVVFLHRDDIAALGFDDGDHVDLSTRWDDDDIERCARDFRIVEYDTPRGTAAAYYPETNPLVPLDHVAEGSHQPASKSVIISLSRAGAAQGTTTGGQNGVDAEEGEKDYPRPEHLS
ncbi:FdhF/YdeP family oxidoreductase [Pseudonocardia abyssalis]|uniref:FdhF/YdeP family oxidoreductase n=1 Tax=Pseudonocardia abyssalis TaxID=2792008 RepID=A0ABS6UP30_9PSEU|nr:FdhF/YdeP family oxidoreductase [Pseudonocardia abyssalis]MBW0117472.1 FdhF/YdeP family oxidoreductase [Pseudonocardia abyssalis]MBW0133544.1 FdhF/YdeP family oxidoreductase [Pseudonocardia abyssalis]